MKKIINIVCKVLLILSYLLILSKTYVGNVGITLEVIILIASTIGILKTNVGNCKLFLIIGILSLCIVVVLPVIIALGMLFLWLFFKLFGLFRGESLLHWLKGTITAVITIKGSLLLIVLLLIIGVVFLVIYKRNIDKK